MGLSESAISRMKSGEYVLERGKPFELAALFVRLHRSLDALIQKAQCLTPAELLSKAMGLSGKYWRTVHSS